MTFCDSFISVVIKWHIVTANYNVSLSYRAFSDTFTRRHAQHETAYMLVFQTYLVKVELFSDVDAFFCSNKLA